MSLLEEVVQDLERHSAQQGWDAAPRLYALVESDELRRAEPELADQLGLSPDVITLAALEQPSLPEKHGVEEALATIAWPEAVAGCALVMERVVLPPEAEAEIPEDEREALEWAAQHPQ
ncbi:PPA1309 family protein, partial [Actinomadura adrarensis]